MVQQSKQYGSIFLSQATQNNATQQLSDWSSGPPLAEMKNI